MCLSLSPFATPCLESRTGGSGSQKSVMYRFGFGWPCSGTWTSWVPRICVPPVFYPTHSQRLWPHPPKPASSASFPSHLYPLDQDSPPRLPEAHGLSVSICSNSHPSRHHHTHTSHPHLHPRPPLLGDQLSVYSSTMAEALLGRLWRPDGGSDQPASGGPWAVHMVALAHGDAIHLAPEPIRPHLRGCPSRGGPVRLEMPSEMEMWSICL